MLFLYLCQLKMKKILHIYLTVILLGVYMVGTMGFGIHECSTDQTIKVLLLAGEKPCSHTHHHSDVCECGHEHTHDASCCNTKVFVVDDPTSASHNTVSIQAPVVDFEALLCVNPLSLTACADGINQLCLLPLPPYLSGGAGAAPQGAIMSLRL